MRLKLANLPTHLEDWSKLCRTLGLHAHLHVKRDDLTGEIAVLDDEEHPLCHPEAEHSGVEGSSNKGNNHEVLRQAQDETTRTVSPRSKEDQ